jgi:hypothetical protein
VLDRSFVFSHRVATLMGLFVNMFGSFNGVAFGVFVNINAG